MSANDFEITLTAPGYSRKWEKVQAGKYKSEDGRWTIEEEGRGKWFVYHRLPDDSWEAWGEWEWTIYGKECKPFESLLWAMASVEEAEFRGFDQDEPEDEEDD